MPVRNANAVWEGGLKEGNGQMEVESGAYQGRYSYKRFTGEEGTNPEELIGAAHAGCFSMAFASGLEKAGYEPERIDTTANVHLEKVDDEFTITRIELVTEGTVPEIDDETFQEQAQSAKENCPVSRALAGPEIELNATLAS